MEIKEITNKEIWETFLLKCEEKTFLDSWNWSIFQDKQEDKVFRLGVYENDKIIATATVVKIRAKRGTFLFVPHGPVVLINNPKDEILKIIVKKLKELAIREKASFIRMAPIWTKTDENQKLFKELGFRDAPIHIHPELTWELDILKSEGELFQGMRKTTRYLVKKAQKDKDIEIVMSTNLNDLEVFHEILNKTASRHHFVPFSLNYLIEQFSCFNPDGEIAIWLGKYKGEIGRAHV
jgi:lipid II:glycine glycyltransferase (peptidoglycan interpeptide bridge formation enzyme)